MYEQVRRLLAQQIQWLDAAKDQCAALKVHPSPNAVDEIQRMAKLAVLEERIAQKAAFIQSLQEILSSE